MDKEGLGRILVFDVQACDATPLLNLSEGECDRPAGLCSNETSLHNRTNLINTLHPLTIDFHPSGDAFVIGSVPPFDAAL